MKKTMQNNKYLTFSIGNEIFATSIIKTIEVTKSKNITYIPNAPAQVKGVMDFRGEVITVINANFKFNIPKKKKKKKKKTIIVFEATIKTKEMRIAAIVDNVKDVITAEEKDILAIPNLGLKYHSEYLLGMIKNKGNFILILNIDKFFSSEELNFSIEDSEQQTIQN